MKTRGTRGTSRLATCIKLITGHLRSERFCDGHLHSVFESGHLTAILRRLDQVANKHRERLRY